MAEVIRISKAVTEQERVTLRALLARGEQKWNECPCGWFYSGSCCPDKGCKEWKKRPKRVKLYAHEDSDSGYEQGEELGLEDDALKNFAHWGYEIEFEADVNMETGEVKLLSVDGRKIS
jgi:hypothetical protein